MNLNEFNRENVSVKYYVTKIIILNKFEIEL